MRVFQIVAGLILIAISIAGGVLALAVCCTIILAPFGLMMFAGTTGLGAIGLNLIMDRPVWVKPSREAEAAHSRLRRRNKRMI